MILKIDEWNIKTIAQVVYMCSAVIVAYAALEAAKALRSQADAQWIEWITDSRNTGRGALFEPRLREIIKRYGTLPKKQ